MRHSGTTQHGSLGGSHPRGWGAGPGGLARRKRSVVHGKGRFVFYPGRGLVKAQPFRYFVVAGARPARRDFGRCRGSCRVWQEMPESGMNSEYILEATASGIIAALVPPQVSTVVSADLGWVADVLCGRGWFDEVVNTVFPVAVDLHSRASDSSDLPPPTLD